MEASVELVEYERRKKERKIVFFFFLGGKGRPDTFWKRLAPLPFTLEEEKTN